MAATPRRMITVNICSSMLQRDEKFGPCFDYFFADISNNVLLYRRRPFTKQNFAILSESFTLVTAGLIRYESGISG